jgi:hypothetical protein
LVGIRALFVILFRLWIDLILRLILLKPLALYQPVREALAGLSSTDPLTVKLLARTFVRTAHPTSVDVQVRVFVAICQEIAEPIHEAHSIRVALVALRNDMILRVLLAKRQQFRQPVRIEPSVVVKVMFRRP